MSHRGFTLVELLIATMLTLVVLAVAVAIVAPARTSFERDSGAADVTQRLRGGLEVLAADIRDVGAGSALADRARLADSMPVVVPLSSIDEAAIDAGFHALRLVRIPALAAEGRLREAIVSPGDPLRLHAPPACTDAAAVCGFAPDDSIVIFDETATSDVVDVEAVDATTLSIVPASPLAGRFAPGAVVAGMEVATYGLMADENGDRRLVRRTGGGAAMPVLDHVVAFSVDVYGTAVPPVLRDGGRAASYGPRPPLPGVDDERDSWGAGENCTIAADGEGGRGPRLALLGVPGQLVVLTPDMLSDGPWCPGPESPDRFDADLLRIRRIDVHLRVEVASAALRGPAGALFRRAGDSRNTSSWVPDGELLLSLTPRNLAR